MRPVRMLLWCFLSVLFYTASGVCQVDDLRQATGLPFAIDSRIIYGRVSIEGLEVGSKPPLIYVTLLDRNLSSSRATVDKSGYYFFRDRQADGGSLVVEVNGAEVARQQLPPFGPKQQRQDFYLVLPSGNTSAKPGTISAKYAYERSKENAELLQKSADAAEDKKVGKAIKYLKTIVENDPADYGAWTLLGSVYYSSSDFQNAEAAYLAAHKAKPESPVTMINLGRFYLVQKQHEAAIAMLEKAVIADPTSAIAFKMLGEAYLQVKKGSKAVPALNEAIRLQPNEMAECHLLIGRLYDLAGAKNLAAKEYKLFLEKRPDHPDKKKIEKYISENSQ